MTDYPPDLIEKLAKASPTASRVVLGGEYGVRMHSDEEAVRIVLDALASWCGSDLFDPATGQRVTATEMPWEWDDYDRPLLSKSWTQRADLPDSPGDLPLFTLTRKDQT